MEYMDTALIGETAGMVWQYLSTNGKTSLRALEKGLDAQSSAVYMAIGWLAREGKLTIGQE
jgi:hypothetical protein